MDNLNRRDVLKMSAAALAGTALAHGLGCSALRGFRAVPPDPDSLRSLAAKRGKRIGSACSFHLLKSEPRYTEILAREFNCIVPENEMKMETVQKIRGEYDFSYADISTKFAAEHKMQVRGVPLVWHDGLPDWAEKATFSRQEALDILEEHIRTVVKHFKGKVFAWDVLNEAIGDHGPGLQDKGPWFRSIGPDYAEKAYHWAHEADPNALLFYNDFYINRFSIKAQRCYDWLKEQLARGVPIHGIGMQYHIQVDNYPKAQEAIDNMKRFIDLGLIVHITELDVWVPTDYTEADLKKQAEVYRQVFEIVLAVPECPVVNMWGITDLHSWVPYTSGGTYGHALIYDRDFSPKPAVEAIREVLRG